MNKTVYLGLSKLELSKILMYEFWYDYVKPKKDKKSKLWYMGILIWLYVTYMIIYTWLYICFIYIYIMYVIYIYIYLYFIVCAITDDIYKDITEDVETSNLILQIIT